MKFSTAILTLIFGILAYKFIQAMINIYRAEKGDKK